MNNKGTISDLYSKISEVDSCNYILTNVRNSKFDRILDKSERVKGLIQIIAYHDLNKTIKIFISHRTNNCQKIKNNFTKEFFSFFGKPILVQSDSNRQVSTYLTPDVHPMSSLNIICLD